MASPDLEPVAREICAVQGFAFDGRAGAGAFKQTFRVHAGANALALKVYLPGHSPQRAQREIDAMMRCNHPNIARVLRVDAHVSALGAHTYSIEEFLPGGTLTSRLAGGLLTGADLQALAVPLFSALGHLASLRLVHRDIKPDNVLLRKDGTTPVIVDFGLVRDLSAVSITPTWALNGPGTPFYSPPEQLHNKKAMIDWRADQFSLGVLISICTLGIHPYSEVADTPIDIVNRVANYAGVSGRFRAIATAAHLPTLTRMCASWPYERFARPDALLTAWATQ